MTTSTRIGVPVAILALGVACLWGCKPERAGVTEKPSEAAPALDSPAPAGEGSPEITATRGEDAVDPEAPSFEVAGLAFARPEGWTLRSPGPMRAAELAHEGIPGAAIVFTHFGARGAGSTPDNLTRWARQVVDEDGEPTLPEVTEASAEVDGVTRKITLARYEGSYLSGMPGQPAEPMPGTLFLGAIVEGGPQGTVYMRAFGPREAMREHTQAVLAMLMGEPAR